MFITDLKQDFFNPVIKERVLVIVNLDVDSVCATKILQYLFKCENVLYTIIPVKGKRELYDAFNKQTEGIKNVILINCGATIDLYGLLQPPDHITIYVADNHRPIDVENIHNSGQIKLLMQLDTDEQLPEFEDVFRDDSSDEEASDEEDDDEWGEKRPRIDEEKLLRRRDRREWEEKRDRILFEYTQYSFYGSSTSILMYRLAWKLSRDCNDLLWWAIVGHTELSLMQRLEEDKVVIDTSYLQNHVVRLNTVSEGELPKDVMKINSDRELNLTLYRHWTLLSAMRHTPHIALKFKLFSLKGEQKIKEFLADLGIPLSQSNQNFKSMDFSIKQEVLESFSSKAEKYGLNELFYKSFNCSFGFRHKFCAADMVWAITATLEHGDQKLDQKEAFFRGLDILSRQNADKLEHSIGEAIQQQEIIFRHTRNILDLKQVISMGGQYLYTIIREGTPDAVYISRPMTLITLARSILQGHISNMKTKKVSSQGLVLVAPLDETAGLSVAVGIPPFSDTTRKNLFGKAFYKTVNNFECRYLIDYWDSSLIQIKTEDRTKFLDGLMSILM